MRFCPWYPLVEAERHTPAGPGVFQVRLAQGLIGYPAGKSAMVHYGWAEADLRAAVTTYAAGAGARAELLCRHSEEMTADELRYPRAAHDRLREQFVRRFGAPPGPPR